MVTCLSPLTSEPSAGGIREGKGGGRETEDKKERKRMMSELTD